METPWYNLYYEMPEGGGNLHFETEREGIARFQSMLEHYPDSYLCLTEMGGKYRTLSEFIPARYS